MATLISQQKCVVSVEVADLLGRSDLQADVDLR